MSHLPFDSGHLHLLHSLHLHHQQLLLLLRADACLLLYCLDLRHYLLLLALLFLCHSLYLARWRASNCNSGYKWGERRFSIISVTRRGVD